MLNLFLPLILGFSVLASDHIDGPITTEHAAADITDFYAFPIEESLVLVMNLYPGAPSDAHFEDRLIYSFVLRSIAVEGQGVVSNAASELRIDCRIKDSHRTEGELSCQSANGLVNVTGKVNQVVSSGGVKVFAGLRSDPFIFNGSFAKKVVKDGMIPSPGNGNDMDQLNILALVIELPKAILPAQKLIGAATEVFFQETGAMKAPEQLDRVGRPEITNVTMNAEDSELDLRDEYNTWPSFDVPASAKKDYKDRIAANIRSYDMLDNVSNWSESEVASTADLLVEDYLLIKLDAACASENNFLSIEKAILQEIAISTCGGRFLEDDIMDDIFTWYISKDAKVYSDGANEIYRKPTKAFPYLAEPDTSFSARAKAWLARKFFF